ncbi:hypothetical protein SAMN06297251_10634 [Fulvimarina manganoxydans]|uniref:Uncharacterized protein n=1 Tax=Fulvimarina manganoxydans TaxID=937218 RepID=A0A1W2BBS2_9HYPH|nr:hypothetical protein SAMN06297251_10634 [Fulvimarina manganoxydans]
MSTQSVVCQWCGTAKANPYKPCSSAGLDELRAFYWSGNAPERCKEEVKKRGLV